MQMRRHIAVSATLLALTLLLAIANAGSAANPSPARQAGHRSALHPAAPNDPNDIFTVNDGFVTRTYNHLGDPASGS
jgi:hypothetical protein